MAMSNRIILVASRLAALLPLAGCTGGDKLPTVPVTGTVTYNGAPLEGATVSFLPKDQSEGARGASGTTDAQGKFKLETFLAGNKMVAGALVGEYAVTVSKREDLSEKFAAMARGGGPPQGEKPSEEGAPRPAPSTTSSNGSRPPEGGGPPPGNITGMVGKSLIPEKYENPQNSGFTATVKQSANEPFKFELTD
jgi:hypothetical protein